MSLSPRASLRLAVGKLRILLYIYSTMASKVLLLSLAALPLVKSETVLGLYGMYKTLPCLIPWSHCFVSSSKPYDGGLGDLD